MEQSFNSSTTFAVSKAGLNEFDPSEIKKRILDVLADEKEREILTRRFGIDNKLPETLGLIGKTFGVTRERIRQIEKGILKKLGASPVLSKVFLTLEDIISEKGGIVTTPELEKLLNINDSNSRIFLRILLESSNKIQGIDNSQIKDSWVIKKYSLELVSSIATVAEEILRKENKAINSGKLTNLILGTLENSEDKSLINPSFVNTVLQSAKNIGRTPDNKLGLTKWGIVNPRNTRDKAYAIFKRVKKPLHYRKLTELIKEAEFSKKMMGVEAVHNELIRDSRFVLIGRGIYALKEWGYRPGTVSQVIEEIFKKEERPMHKNEIIEKVLDKRIVKKNTILLNLQEKPQFERVKRAVYKLKEKQ